MYVRKTEMNWKSVREQADYHKFEWTTNLKISIMFEKYNHREQSFIINIGKYYHLASYKTLLNISYVAQLLQINKLLRSILSIL